MQPIVIYKLLSRQFEANVLKLKEGNVCKVFFQFVFCYGIQFALCLAFLHFVKKIAMLSTNQNREVLSYVLLEHKYCTRQMLKIDLNEFVTMLIKIDFTLLLIVNMNC